MKKISMNVASRLIILMNMPEQGSVIDMIAQRNIRKKIDFSSEEVEAIKMKNEKEKIVWSPSASNIDVEFSENEIQFLKTVVDKLDKSGLVTDSILDFVQEILNN